MYWTIYVEGDDGKRHTSHESHTAAFRGVYSDWTVKATRHGNTSPRCGCPLWLILHFYFEGPISSTALKWILYVSSCWSWTCPDPGKLRVWCSAVRSHVLNWLQDSRDFQSWKLSMRIKVNTQGGKVWEWTCFLHFFVIKYYLIFTAILTIDKHNVLKLITHKQL